MKTSLLLLSVIIFATLPRAAAAQTHAGGVEHFSKDGLSFDYPVGWTPADKSDARTQRVVLTREGSASFVEVAVLRDAGTTSAEKKAAEESLWASGVEAMARRLGDAKIPAKTDYQCPPFGERPGSGVRLGGRFEGRPGKGEVYAMAAGGRFLNVSFLRTEQEESVANAAWKTVLETLKVDGDEGDKKMVIGVVVNGKALSKPQPTYPREARSSGASGAVTVKILVDVKGDVISAQAVSGDPLLYAASETAARHAKYTPTTLCGRPVKVAGVITYTFRLY